MLYEVIPCGDPGRSARVTTRHHDHLRAKGSEQPDDPDRGLVEFRATYRRKGEKMVHHELAEFRT